MLQVQHFILVTAFILTIKKNPAPQSVQGIQAYSVVYGNKAITLARLIATVRAL